MVHDKVEMVMRKKLVKISALSKDYKILDVSISFDVRAAIDPGQLMGEVIWDV